MESIPEFKEFIKKVLPKDCIGTQNKYVEQNKLTAYYVNKKKQIIFLLIFNPNRTQIHFTKYFESFQKQPEGNHQRRIQITFQNS